MILNSPWMFAPAWDGDEFNGPLTGWTAVGITSNYTAETAGGLLTFGRTLPTSPGGTGIILAKTLADGGAWVARVNPTALYAGLYVRTAAGNGVGLWTDGSYAYVQPVNSTMGDTGYWGAVARPAGMHYQRVRRVGSLLYLGSSADGISYTEVSGTIDTVTGVGFATRDGAGALTAEWIRG
jgi:hypothetical protein